MLIEPNHFRRIVTDQNGSQMPKTADKEDEDSYEKTREVIGSTTSVIITPDGEDHGFPEGTMWLYSIGMYENYGIPDIEMRGVDTRFAKAGVRVINEMNAYRLLNLDNPMLVGQTVQWNSGNFIITESEEWDGMYSWNKETMIRMSSREIEIHCTPCQMDDAGAEA